MHEVVAVLGAGGFVGSQLVNTLKKNGNEVIALLHDEKNEHVDKKALIGEFLTPEEFSTPLQKAHTLIHVASSSTPGSTAGHPLNELEGNLRPTLSLLAALQNAPHCRLVYVSSGGTLYGDTADRPATETDSLHPCSYYGAAKAAAEHFINAATVQFSLKTTILRPSNLYGPGQAPRHGFGVIPTAFKHALSGTPLTIWGDGSAVRDYLYIDDFIDLCCNLIEQPMPTGSRTFNVASGQSVSLTELIELIRRVTKAPIPTRHLPSRAADVTHSTLDITQVKKITGWLPKTSLEDGLSRSWEWWLKRSA